MSFDDYANHIYQKHRLAVALAIIKSKPANIKTEKYLEELKFNIDHNMDDDDGITVCSDDFLMADDEMNDSETILKNIDPEFVNTNGDDYAAIEKPFTTPEITNRIIPENLSQVTYYDGSQNQATFDIGEPFNNITQSQDDFNINKIIDDEDYIPKNVLRQDFNDSTRTFNQNTGIELKSTQKSLFTVSDSNVMQSKVNQNMRIEQSTPKNDANKELNERIMVDQNTVIDHRSYQKTYPKENNNDRVDSNSKSIANKSNESADVTFYDSQKTIPYTVHGFTQNYTHYSPSQIDIIIPNKYLYNVSINNNDIAVQHKISKENHTVAAKDNDFENETQFVSTKGLNVKSVKNPTNKEEFEYIETMNMFSQSNNDHFDEIRNNITVANKDNQETINNISAITNNDTKNVNNQNCSTHHSQNIDEYFDEMRTLKENDSRYSFPTENRNNETRQNPKIAENMEINDGSYGYSQNIDYLSQNQDISHSQNEFETQKVNYTNDESNVENLTQNTEADNQIATILSGNDSSDKHRREDEEFESEEIISYKVLEEFNKVKSFLMRQNRRMSCDGYSTDSGYRSDSQRSYRSALQLSGNWLNQSGCCLFNYIMQCPLVAGTRDITNEIAQVISQLIDRLHEEEKYPSFLEELLETVDLLLGQIYEGDSSEDGEFLKKDENIQRILLLNKSIHIQRHSLEKITKILEHFHSKVTEIDSTYELTNIDQIENITYIFHILEILLNKFLKNREILSQTSTQNSQDDEKGLKKSSITDIWRKKWNPSQKVFVGSREKKCVLKNCSEILNKIVVDCVSSYSLIAYSALKCFNCMQS